MIVYLYNYFSKNKHWSATFINLLKTFLDIFTRNGIICKYLTDDDTPNENDILIAISGIINNNNNNINVYKCKIIIVNSESISNTKKSNHYTKLYINNPNINILEIWDYSKRNVNNLKKIISIPCYYVPITYDHCFEQIFDFNDNIKKDIDIAFYGEITGEDNRRLILLNKLKEKYNIWYGNTENKDILTNILNRSKIVIIIHFYKNDLCIDYYRLYSLISNKVFVIHEMPSSDQIDNNMNKLLFVEYDKIIETCDKYLSMTQKNRNRIVTSIYRWWKTEHKFVDKIPKTIFNLTK